MILPHEPLIFSRHYVNISSYNHGGWDVLFVVMTLYLTDTMWSQWKTNDIYRMQQQTRIKKPYHTDKRPDKSFCIANIFSRKYTRLHTHTPHVLGNTAYCKGTNVWLNVIAVGGWTSKKAKTGLLAFWFYQSRSCAPVLPTRLMTHYSSKLAGSEIGRIEVASQMHSRPSQLKRWSQRTCHRHNVSFFCLLLL
jgi:hypothetical protein